MPRPGFLNTLLFWLMLLAGAAALAPSLVLPAWVERQAQLDCLAAHAEHVAQLRAELQSARKQIEHLNSDPAYLLRVAEEDFGQSLRLPNVELIRIAPGSVDPVPPPQAAAPTDETGTDLLPELGQFIESALQRYPRAQIFLQPDSRPVVTALGGTLVTAAIVLLCLLERPARPAAADTASEP